MAWLFMANEDETSPSKSMSPASPRSPEINLFGESIKPSVIELDVMLELMMEDVNLTEEKKLVIRKLPSDRKWMMLVQNLSERYRVGPQEVLQEIQEIQKLKEGQNKELLQNLVVSLRSRPIRWISDFIENGGLGVLLDNLNDIEEQEMHNEYEELYIKCLKSFMNNKTGLSAVLETDGALNVIALSLRSPSARTKALVLEIFGAVCLLPGGHGPVLEAMDAVCEVAATRFRMEIVVYSLWQSCRGMAPPDKDLQVACMAFINAVVCGGPGVNLEFRLHMRWEFIQLGLLQLIDKIGHVDNELLQTQIDVWIAGMEQDEAELFSRLETEKVNTDDAMEIARVLSISLKASSCEAPFASILRHFTLLPKGSFERMKYIMVIDKMIQQLMLQRNGEDADPTMVIANIDMRDFVGEMDKIESLKEQEQRYQKQVEKAKRLEKEIEQLKAELTTTKKTLKSSGSVSEDRTSLPGVPAPTPSPGMGGPPPPPPPPGMGGPPPPPPPPGMSGPPPPPPPPGMGGPPPPPPPPGTAIVNQGMGGPPPPPGMGPPPPPGMPLFHQAAAAASKPLNLSSKPLKSFNWTKIPPNKVKDTIWEQIDDADIHQKLKKKVYNEFEELFAAKETKTVEQSNEKLDQTPKEISFLDSKRSQNVNIMLKAIKLDPTSIKKAILTVDLHILPRFVLTELLKLIPTEDELAAVKQYENDFHNLASAERFMFEISEISRYEQKLNAMFFKASFAEYQEDAEGMISSLKKATEDVVQSKKFKNLLKVVLALGNYLNPGQRGGAYGFKLNSLLKMIDTKSTISNRKHTLLHYLVELVEKEFKDVIGFQNELMHVEDGSKVGIPAIRMALITIRDNLKSLDTLLKQMEEDKQKTVKEVPSATSVKSIASNSSAVLNTKFIEVMKKFYDQAKKVYDSQDEVFKQSEKEFEQAVLLYGEDPKNTTPEEFFGIFAKFTQSYVAAKIDNEAALAKEASEKKREEAKKVSMNLCRMKKKRESRRGWIFRRKQKIQPTKKAVLMI
jgi:hypothetical protein